MIEEIWLYIVNIFNEITKYISSKFEIPHDKAKHLLVCTILLTLLPFYAIWWQSILFVFIVAWGWEFVRGQLYHNFSWEASWADMAWNIKGIFVGLIFNIILKVVWKWIT